jgi:hypothetical protein
MVGALLLSGFAVKHTMHTVTIAVALTGLLAAAPAFASGEQNQQNAPQAHAQPTAQSGAPDFLLGRPHGSFGIRGSWMFARADSDLFHFVQRHLTVDKKDFNTPAYGLDFSWMVTPRIDVQFGFEASNASKASEYRDFVDNQLLPIEQDTSLRERNISGSVRFSLMPRGQGVSRYAWVPRTFTPYVGAGAGALW